MMNNSYKIMFLFILMLGTMITVSANSWFSAWMGLEINLLSFIPLMSDNNLMSTESSLKYFLIQALASTVFLFSTILIMLENYYLTELKFIFNKILILLSLMLKMGVAPFHFWFPNVIKNLSWNNSFILMTWQKIAPFIMSSYIIYKPLIIMCAIFSAILGAIGGMNQTSLHKLMAYSSINHLSWMLLAITKNEMLWFIYFSLYSFLTFTMILMFKMFNISHINQLFMISLKSKSLKFVSFFNLLSLGGLPPFMGFIPKWMIIQYLSSSNQFISLFILISSALITLYIYIRLCYSSFMMNNSETNWNLLIQFNKFMMTMYLFCSSISIAGLLMISLVYLML